MGRADIVTDGIMQPQMDADQRRLTEATEKVIGCCYAVSNTLGCGFLEKVYENAVAIELREQGFVVEQQRSVSVQYKGTMVGEYFADLLVDGEILVEIKAAKAFDSVHIAQCMNYLKACSVTVCLLVNFGQPRVEIKRLVNNY